MTSLRTTTRDALFVPSENVAKTVSRRYSINPLGGVVCPGHHEDPLLIDEAIETLHGHFDHKCILI